jgi:hypothetical protein
MVKTSSLEEKGKVVIVQHLNGRVDIVTRLLGH